MTATTPKVLFLTGAPEQDKLDWEDANLISAFESPIRRFLGEGLPQKSTANTTQQSFTLPKWRALSLPTPSVAAQRGGHQRQGRQLVSFQDAPGPVNTRELEHLNFLEHSLAVLQDLESSQIEVPDGTFVDQTTTFTSGSFDATFATNASLLTSHESLSTYSSEHPEQQIVSFSGPLTDLKRIPTSRHLRSIHPQTMSVNILASVISVQPARTVRLRKRAGEMDVIEILLGDETRAGFGVSFWVVPIDSQTVQHKSSAKDGLRQILDTLRTGDVLLLTHIALQEYQNNVSGQSLSRRITRNNTTVTVLSDTVTGLSVPVAAKLQRVRDWSAEFIGRGTKRAASPESPSANAGRRISRRGLPPETQTQPGG